MKNKFINFIQIFILFFFSNFFNRALLGNEINIDKYISSGPLAGAIYYTKESPGRWLGLSEPHIPDIKIEKNIIEVHSPHEMRGFEHYIVKHIIMDEKFRIISEKIFDATKDIPLSKHDVSGYFGNIYILSVCNLHDTWLTIKKAVQN